MLLEHVEHKDQSFLQNNVPNVYQRNNRISKEQQALLIIAARNMSYVIVKWIDLDFLVHLFNMFHSSIKTSNFKICRIHEWYMPNNILM